MQAMQRVTTVGSGGCHHAQDRHALCQAALHASCPLRHAPSCRGRRSLAWNPSPKSCGPPAREEAGKWQGSKSAHPTISSNSRHQISLAHVDWPPCPCPAQSADLPAATAHLVHVIPVGVVSKEGCRRHAAKEQRVANGAEDAPHRAGIQRRRLCCCRRLRRAAGGGVSRRCALGCLGRQPGIVKQLVRRLRLLRQCVQPAAGRLAAGAGIAADGRAARVGAQVSTSA